MTEAEQRQFCESLQTHSTSIGIPLSETMTTQALIFTEYLLEVNTYTNLTRIVAPEAIVVKHFVDSLLVFTAVPQLPEGATVADVGTGAGFPGMVLKIVRPDLQITLLDSLKKRLTFLDEAIRRLQLTGMTTVHLRAEEAGRHPHHRDKYDLVTARAVAALPTLMEWCAPLVRPHGQFLALKGQSVDEEREEAAEIQKQLKLRLLQDIDCTLPTIAEDTEPAHRRLLLYTKTAPTPIAYPHPPAETRRKSR
jgi:16S rRNA (guanine527-N7)-methyltransferase